MADSFNQANRFNQQDTSDSETRIGMVLGTEDATPLQFWFAVPAGTKVQLDDVVYAAVPDPSDPDDRASDVHFYGIVDDVRRRYEGVQFDGDTELVTQGLMPANVAYAAHVLVTRVDPEEFIPPAPGDSVYAAHADSLEKALYLDNMDTPLPAGVLRSGDAGYLNFDFINGSKGAHINISGISGIATKTSYALFLLYSIFNAKKRGQNTPIMTNVNSKALIFNVKGQDLLFLDKPNKDYLDKEGKWQAKTKHAQTRYDICELPTNAFDSVALHAPAKAGNNLMPDSNKRQDAHAYVWTLHDFAAERMLPFALVERDAMTNLGFLVAHVEEKLAKLAAGQTGPWLEVPEKLNFEDDIPSQVTAIGEDEGLDSSALDSIAGLSPGTRLTTFSELITYLELKLLYEADGEGDKTWTASQAKGTREALIRRLRGASKYLSQLIRGDIPVKRAQEARLEVLDTGKQVHVVDIHQLAPLAQMFVVGVLLKQVFSQQETRQRGQVFVVLDELNKYAPAEGTSPIKDVLLDIAERGRSMGIILIGAQQTASEVERRIVSNAAVRVVGRLDAAEAERSEYRFMPGSFRMRATILAPGTMVVHQPDVPTPMMLSFPFPAWATREDETDITPVVAEVTSDTAGDAPRTAQEWLD
ncbi:MAG: ATP-binding protein [Deinococcota bacterium]